MRCSNEFVLQGRKKQDLWLPSQQPKCLGGAIGFTDVRCVLDPASRPGFSESRNCQSIIRWHSPCAESFGVNVAKAKTCSEKMSEI